MFKIVKSYRKQILVVFGVAMMVIFIATPGGGMSGGGGSDPVIAHLGEQPIHYVEAQQSRRHWERLKRTFIDNISPDGRPVPAIARLGDIGAQLIDQHPENFLLLRKEAERLGLTASPDGIEELIRNTNAMFKPTTQADVYEQRQAFEALLLVEAGYARAASIVKTPTPQKTFMLASEAQSIRLNVIQYQADEFKSAVAAPSAEQLQEHFKTYADQLSGQPSATNPFGFGYKLPNRVKLEYLTVLRTQVRDAVYKGKTPTDWEIEARKYYLKNKASYPELDPTSATAPASLPIGIATLPSTLPTTQPKLLDFAHYQKEITDRLVDQQTDSQLEDVRKKIAATLEADWAAYRAALGSAATRPSTQPAGNAPKSSLGVAYSSEQYLPALQLQIQQEFKFLPVMNLIARDWQTQKDLNGLAGIGAAYFSGAQFTQVKFPEYAINFLDAFGHTPGAREIAPPLSIYAPSPALSDEQENLHFFRITDADPAHAATDLAAVRQKVEEDYKFAQAMKAARAEAEKIVPVAKQQGFDSAVQATGRKVITTGRISARGIETTPELLLKEESKPALVTGAFDLLKFPAAAVESGKAVAAVDLPLEGKVLVIALAKVEPAVPGFPREQIESFLSRRLIGQMDQAFQSQWFDGPSIEKRLQYKVAER